MERGFELDTAFYVQHAAAVRDRPPIDPAVDPPPDLVIEVDVANSSREELPIYTALGVPEVWRCRQGRVAIYLLRGGAYEEASASAALPFLSTEMLDYFLAEGRVRPRLAWWRWVRERIRQLDSDAALAP